MRRRTGWLTAGAAAAGVLLVAWPASAHVTVSAPGATAGGSDQVITFRVPTESDSASTTKVQVKFPTTTPIASVLVAPHPGWTDSVITTKLSAPIHTDDGDITEAVSEVTWTANSAADGIKPGQYGEFDVLAGLLPDVASLTFPAIQTYSDGSSVAWIETAAPGSSTQPEHPAPTLALSGAPGQSTSPLTVFANPSSKKTSNTGPIVLSIIALVIAAAALGLAVVSRARAGTRTS